MVEAMVEPKVDEEVGSRRGLLHRIFRRRERFDPDRIDGNNTLRFRNRRIFGPDARWAWLTFFLIAAPAIMFLIIPDLYILRNNPVLGWILVIISKLILTVGMSAMWKAMSNDPGIIPRAKSAALGDLATVEDEDPEAPREECCEVCKISKSGGIEHCERCDNCVVGFNHHSKMLGTCIGKRNLRYYFHFLFATTFACFLRTAGSIVYLVHYTNQEAAEQGITNNEAFSYIMSNTASSVALVVIFVSLIEGVFTTYLMCKHIFCRPSNHDGETEEKGRLATVFREIYSPIPPSLLWESVKPTQDSLKELEIIVNPEL